MSSSKFFELSTLNKLALKTKYKSVCRFNIKFEIRLMVLNISLFLQYMAFLCSLYSEMNGRQYIDLKTTRLFLTYTSLILQHIS